MLCALATGLAGCGKHQGEVGWLREGNQPGKPYKVLRSVSGSASLTSVVGVRTDRSNLYQRARENLIDNAELKPGEYLINRTMDEHVATFPPTIGGGLLEPVFTMFQVYGSKTVILSADVIRIQKPDR